MDRIKTIRIAAAEFIGTAFLVAFGCATCTQALSKETWTILPRSRRLWPRHCHHCSRKKAMSRKTPIFRVVLAEFLATALLVGVGCASCTNAISHTIHSPVATSLAFGLLVGSLVQIFGHISGAHLNPAVTVCAVILEEIPPELMFAYILSQIFGGIAGYAILMLITPAAIIREDSHQDFGCCTTVPNLELSTLNAFCTEFLATSMLILLVCSSWDARNPNRQNLPMQFALGITALGIVFGSRTGPSMNPARSFGPAVWNGVWTKHWIYWVAPLFAAMLVTTMYKSIFGFTRNLREEKKDDANQPNDMKVENANQLDDTELQMFLDRLFANLENPHYVRVAYHSPPSAVVLAGSRRKFVSMPSIFPAEHVNE